MSIITQILHGYPFTSPEAGPWPLSALQGPASSNRCVPDFQGRKIASESRHILDGKIYIFGYWGGQPFNDQTGPKLFPSYPNVKDNCIEEIGCVLYYMLLHGHYVL